MGCWEKNTHDLIPSTDLEVPRNDLKVKSTTDHLAGVLPLQGVPEGHESKPLYPSSTEADEEEDAQMGFQIVNGGLPRHHGLLHQAGTCLHYNSPVRPEC
jgi:hypothetical protein